MVSISFLVLQMKKFILNFPSKNQSLISDKFINTFKTMSSIIPLNPSSCNSSRSHNTIDPHNGILGDAAVENRTSSRQRQNSIGIDQKISIVLVFEATIAATWIIFNRDHNLPNRQASGSGQSIYIEPAASYRLGTDGYALWSIFGGPSLIYSVWVSVRAMCFPLWKMEREKKY